MSNSLCFSLSISVQIRRLVSDFAVFISVVVWVVVDVLAQVNTPKLAVNNVFEEGLFTQANRTSIFINPLGMPAYCVIIILVVVTTFTMSSLKFFLSN